MTTFFAVPKEHFDNLLEKNRYTFLWNLSLFMIPLFLLSFIADIYYKNPGFIISLFIILLSTIILVLLKNSKNTKIAIPVFVGVSLVLCMLSIFTLKPDTLLVTISWSILFLIICFYLLAFKIALIVLFIVFICVQLRLFLIGSFECVINSEIILNLSYMFVAFIMVVYYIIKTINESQNKLYADQEEREILLRELHHRVKNNLQIVSSLLKLQAEESNDTRVYEEFSKAIKRIKSMSLIHEKLYNTSKIFQIDLKEYLTDLMKNIVFSYNDVVKIQTEIDIHDYFLQLNKMIPLSLIMNELLTDAIENSFDKNQEKTILLKIYQKNDHVILHFLDSGTSKKNFVKNEFGLLILELLTQQLDGKIERNYQGDGSFYFEFQKSDLLVN